jgi:uncharacterized membrane protein YkoI
MRGVLLPLAAAAALLGAGHARAQAHDSLGADWGPQQNEARQRVRAGQNRPLEQVVASVRRQIPGRLLDAGLEEDGGRQVYRVRWAAADGRRLDVIADAATGQVIRQEGR